MVVTTTMADGMLGPLIPEVREALPMGQEVIDRSTVNACHDERVRSAVTAIGRSKLIIAGVSLEVCAALPAIAATARGLRCLRRRGRLRHILGDQAGCWAAADTAGRCHPQ
jgi:Isochorismatase family